MRKKTTAEEKAIALIRTKMEEADIYESRYDIQIEQTANNMVEIEAMQAIIKRDGRVMIEAKTGGVGNRYVSHPLIIPKQNAEALLVRQLASLGLNKMSEKKVEAAQKKQTSENNPFMGLQEAMRGN